MNEKILSVIVPSYNMETFLPKCLGSLIVEDEMLLRLLDVIVVNDGSKDRTSEVAHDWAARHSGVIRVIDKPNGNYGSCINAALPAAAGVFVKILDADDAFSSVEFCKYLKALQKSELNGENVDLFVTDFVTVDRDGKEVGQFRRSMPAGCVVAFDHLNAREIFYMHAVAYRTALLRSMRYRQTEGISYTDNEWVCYPMEHVKNVRYEKIPLYRYLVGREGQTVDPKVLAKNLWMRGVIAKRMAHDYGHRSGCTESVRHQYVRNYEAMIAAQVYETAIVGVATRESDQYLAQFDAALSGISPELRQHILDNVLLSRRIGFHYGKCWLKRRNSRVIALRMFRIYLGLVKRLSQN